MPFYSDEIIQELKNQADIALVIQQFLPLGHSAVLAAQKKRGQQIRRRVPIPR